MNEDIILEKILERLETFNPSLWKPTDFAETVYVHRPKGNKEKCRSYQYTLYTGGFRFSIFQFLDQYKEGDLDGEMTDDYSIKISGFNTDLFDVLTSVRRENTQGIRSRAGSLYHKIHQAGKTAAEKFAVELEANRDRTTPVYRKRVEQGRHDLLEYLGLKE